METKTKDFKQAKKEIRALGYATKTVRYSEFISLEIMDKTTKKQVYVRGIIHKDYLEEFQAKHKDLLAWVDANKGKIFEGCTRVVL